MQPSAVNPNQPRGWPILNVFGIPIYLEPGFLGLIALLFFINHSDGNTNYAQTGLWTFAIFFSILFHELGHALTALVLGCKGIRIALVMFGGYATHTPTTHGKSLLITLAGPFFGLTLGGAFTLAYFLFLRPAAGEGFEEAGPRGALQQFVSSMIYINILWSLFNLLPMRPLDGGWAVQHTLAHWLKPQSAMSWSARVSIVTCVPIGLIAFRAGPDLMFVGLICLWCFMSNMRELQS